MYNIYYAKRKTGDFLSEQGQVIEVDGQFVIVKLKRQKACANCKICMAGLNDSEMILRAKNECNANTNDYVDIELENVNFLKAAAIMYGIPCIALISGLAIGYLSGNFFKMGETFASVFTSILGLAFVGVSYLFIRLSEKRFRKKEDFIPIATKRGEKHGN